MDVALAKVKVTLSPREVLALAPLTDAVPKPVGPNRRMVAARGSQSGVGGRGPADESLIAAVDQQPSG